MIFSKNNLSPLLAWVKKMSHIRSWKPRADFLKISGRLIHYTLWNKLFDKFPDIAEKVLWIVMTEKPNPEGLDKWLSN